jgi:GWxTD domain-containing protein
MTRVMKNMSLLLLRIVMRSLCIAAAGIIVLLQTVPLTAQEPVVREQTAGNVIAYEHQVIREDSLFRVLIPFRVRYDFFVFVKPTAAATAVFSGSGEVSAELLDSTGSSVARTIMRINLSVTENVPARLRAQFHQDLIAFTVPRGNYTIVFSLEDKESKRRYSDSKRTFRLPSPAPQLIPVVPSNSRTFTMFNLGGDVLFSQHYGFLVQSAALHSTAVYTLRKRMPDDDEPETLVSNASISVTPYEKTSAAATVRNGTVELTLTESSDNSMMYMVFDGSQLRQGRYELSITFPDSTTLTATFGARWMEMPAVLNDLDMAIEPLQFITTKSDYSDLRRGSRESRIKKFEEFWKKKDTTPNTAYNEVMHEFYRRVDAAVTAFRSLREMNGAITDRGKIYILYGPPASTERLLASDGAPKEIWNYKSLNKVFTFEDPSKQGNYKLTEQQ